MTGKKIVIIDDEPDTIEILRDRLVWWNYEVKEIYNGKEALEQLRKREEYMPDLIFLDLMMPQVGGLKVLDEIKKINSTIPVVIMTAHGTMETAVKAVKKGAYDYILKPFVMGEIEKLLKDLFSKETTKIIKAHSIVSGEIGFEGIIGSDFRMMEIYKTIGRIALTDIAVLIRGESGTGKELIARSIHRHSLRKNMPFSPVNCAAIPDTLFESELFGYEKGAFTGADERKIGIFERTDKGTIFLDEIADISISTQAKILRVLQEKEFQRVGGKETIKVDVRVISATNKNLEQLIVDGKFREDLYYRLDGITIEVPPLRKRGDDIVLLAEYFIKKFASKFNKDIHKITQKALTKLSNYDWPGNVREMENTIQRTVANCKKHIILVEDLMIGNPQKRPSFLSNTNNEINDENNYLLSYKDARKKALTKFESQYIREALQRNKGNITQTAREIGLHRQQLQTIMKKHNLKSKDFSMS